MPWTLETLRAKLKETFGADTPDPDTFANAVKEEFQPLYQHVFNLGHGTARAQHDTTAAALQAQIDALTKDKNKALKDLERLQADKPDVAKITADYDARIAELQGKLEEEKKTSRATLNNVILDRAESDLVAYLTSPPNGVDPIIARALARENRARMRVNEQANSVEALAAPGSAVPLQAQEPLKALGDELVKGVDAKYRTATVDTGSNTGRTGAGGQGNVYDKIREDAKKERQSGTAGDGDLDKRFVSAGV